MGARIAARRRQSGISQKDLGAPNYTPGYMSRIESGSRPITWPVLSHLANRLNCRPEDIAPVEMWETSWLEPRIREAIANGDRDAVAAMAPLIRQRRDVAGASLQADVGRALRDWDKGRLALNFFTSGCGVFLSLRCQSQALALGYEAIDLALQEEELPFADAVLQELENGLDADHYASELPSLMRRRSEVELQREGYQAAYSLALRAVDAAPKPSVEAAAALRVASHAAFEVGRADEALTLAEQATSCADDVPDVAQSVRGVLLHAYLVNRQGRPGEVASAVTRLRSLVDTAPQDLSTELLVAARTELARCLATCGRLDLARSEVDALLKRQEQLDPVQVARLYRVLGDIEWQRGNHQLSASHFKESHERLVRCGRRRMAARAMAGLGDHYAAASRWRDASTAYREALITSGLATKRE